MGKLSEALQDFYDWFAKTLILCYNQCYTNTYSFVDIILLLTFSKRWMESVMCYVIKIRLNGRDIARSKIKYKLHLKFGKCSKICHSKTVLIFSGWFPFPLLVAILLFWCIFITSHIWHFTALHILLISF